MAILDTNLENALGVMESLKKEKTVFYGFNNAQCVFKVGIQNGHIKPPSD